MIADDLARVLRESGLGWDPAPGDRFRIEAEALSEDVFILSHMVIEARAHRTGTVLSFNGTTEWALDSVPKDRALWLPREDQLRGFLAGAFVDLGAGDDGFAVRTRSEGGELAKFVADDPEDAYALAVLDLLRGTAD